MNHKTNRPDASGNGAAVGDWLQAAIDENEGSLVRYAQHFVTDVNRAQDVVQETFLKLCKQGRGDFASDPDHIRKWLFRVCRNQAIDISRKENRMKLAPTDQLESEQLALQTDPATNPESVALKREQKDSVALQIKDLPDKQQEALRLKFSGGLSYKEIAEVMGITTSNVGVILHTAIAKLRQRVVTET